MEIEIRRRGGLAGLTLRARLATSELEPTTAAGVERAVSRLLDREPAPPTPHPDSFLYEISVPERASSATVTEQDLPAELSPLVDRLAEHGTIERGSPPSA